MLMLSSFCDTDLRRDCGVFDIKVVLDIHSTPDFGVSAEFATFRFPADNSLFPSRERYRGRPKNTGVLEGTKVLMHVQTEVVYSTASDYPMTKRRHAGLRCPSETDLASSMGDLSPSSSGKQMIEDDYDHESVEGRGGRLFWSDRR